MPSKYDGSCEYYFALPVLLSWKFYPACDRFWIRNIRDDDFSVLASKLWSSDCTFRTVGRDGFDFNRFAEVEVHRMEDVPPFVDNFYGGFRYLHFLFDSH